MTPEQLHDEAWDDGEACQDCEYYETDPEVGYYACGLYGRDPLTHCLGIKGEYVVCSCGHAVEQYEQYSSYGQGPAIVECENCGREWADGEAVA